jgi:beta-lactam-binding protein with PASTA domain
VKRRFSGKIKKGRVVRSGKHRGVVLPAGRKVKLTVSRGPKPKAHGKPKGRH